MAEAETRQKKRLEKVKDFLSNFHPYAETKVSFNDNIYLTPSETVEDIITEITPGIKYEVSSEENRLKLLLDGGVRFKNYVQENQHDTENPYGIFAFSYGLGRLSFDLKHDYKKDQDEVSQITTGSIGDLVDYRRNESMAKLNLDLSHSSWDFWYYRLSDSYDRGEQELTNNYNEDTVSLAGAWKVFPKSSVFLEYDHSWRYYTKGGRLNREFDKYWFGIRGDISTKLKGTAKAGYEKGDYEDKSTKSGSTVNLNLAYQASPRVEYDLIIERAIGDSDISGEILDLKQTYTFICKYLPAFNKKLRLSAGIEYELDEYESSRQDDTYSLKFISEYELREWLKLSGEYEFDEVVSNVSSAEYKNNILSLGLRYEF